MKKIETFQNLTLVLEKSFILLAVDPTNQRMRLNRYQGDIQEILSYLEDVAQKQGLTKSICLVKEADIESFMAYGYVIEAISKWYFQGIHAYVLCKYFSVKRHDMSFEQEENDILLLIGKQVLEPRKPLKEGFVARRATVEDAPALSEVYTQCFEVYPTPLKEISYIEKCIQGDTIFQVVTFEGKVVSAASAEMNSREKNAELTDCATLPEFRKYGLIRYLLYLLEEEMRTMGYVSIYSIARALSFGMNKALYQEDFQYTGRLCMNCYIFDKLEDMNLWVKKL